MEENNTEKSQIIEPVNLTVHDDMINPTQLLWLWSDECGGNGEVVLGTFTSKIALGLFLVEKALKSDYLDNGVCGLLDNLHLQKIIVNPEYEVGKC